MLEEREQFGYTDGPDAIVPTVLWVDTLTLVIRGCCFERVLRGSCVGNDTSDSTVGSDLVCGSE